ncbi:hypothetical protein BRARA_E01769 [Brassica rapa]|uniref:Uncharacterized protein n=2 Tax=Brassica TaxID=3705 RepID=A0A397ZCM6_BRACM|nr:uncharacterized protein LOC103874759 [Brassica rapa]XP_048635504.1 uncharacterized protein LOC125608909 [Brassica napus]RID62718.1 hypothetical protein BRARA_E01769 [Brassica rapa]CAF2098902.1 unnamed protein product [Brassica napus]CAG7876481.1 unnamed protein product [Brassica rapa]CDY26912.1 BnaA05g18000D [Brassica napus]VDC71637.1 unnamed protein product [Brassica rapa]
MDEDGFSQCPKHFSKRGFIGVCPFCLHERLSSLCPDCATDIPCSCSSRAAVCFSPSSSSSSSSFSLFAFSFPGSGSVGQVASLIECEPAFRRSKSMAVPIKPDTVDDSGSGIEPARGLSRKTVSFWRMLMGNKGGDTKPAIMRKSRSVAVVGDMKYPPATGKGKGWSFPSPSKVFRQSKMIFQQRSPLYRG